MSYFFVRTLVKELAEKEEGRLAKLEGEARELALQELAVQELREEWGVEVEVEDDEVVEVEVSHYSLFRWGFTRAKLTPAPLSTFTLLRRTVNSAGEGPLFTLLLLLRSMGGA